MNNDFSFADYELKSDGQVTEKIDRNAVSAEEKAILEFQHIVKDVIFSENSENPFGRIFYRQGKVIEFMTAQYSGEYIPELCADSFGYRYMPRLKKNFPAFHPCYQDLSILHLKYYLWWRNEFRSGIYHPTSIPYLKLYAYELANGIGGLPPKKTLARLVYLWKKMKAIDKHCDFMMMNIIKSFYCVNEITNLPYEKVCMSFPYVNAIGIQLNLSEDYSDIYEICAARLPANTLNSTFAVSENGHYLRESLPSVFCAVAEYLAQNNIDLRKLILGMPTPNLAWQPFRNIPYCAYKPVPDKRVDLSDTQWCVHENGTWTSWAIFPTPACYALVGHIFRLADCALRRQTMFNSKLRPTPKNLLDAVSKGTACSEQYERIAQDGNIIAIVEKATAEFLLKAGYIPPVKPSKRKNIPEEKPFVIPDIKFDFSKLETIRGDADYLREKLVTDDDFDEEAPVEKDETVVEMKVASASFDEGDEFAELVSQLDDTQKKALSLCLYSEDTAKDLSALAKEAGSMPSVIIDDINTLSLDIIGDTVIENAAAPHIIEDYEPQLKELL